MCFVFNIVSSINIEMYYLFLLQISRLLTGLLFHLTTSMSLCLVLMMRVTTRATSLHLFISLKNKWSHRLSHRVREKKHQQKAVCPGTSQAVFLYQVASNNKPIARCSPLKVPRGRTIRFWVEERVASAGSRTYVSQHITTKSRFLCVIVSCDRLSLFAPILGVIVELLSVKAYRRNA